MSISSKLLLKKIITVRNLITNSIFSQIKIVWINLTPPPPIKDKGKKHPIKTKVKAGLDNL